MKSGEAAPAALAARLRRAGWLAGRLDRGAASKKVALGWRRFYS
ncbi:hypothetical protein L528_1893 [Bordetella bronchiseptica MBORD849]|nr:hypothetical protein L528_1893 [Bordetella bronchiseptica MBORD849]